MSEQTFNHAVGLVVLCFVAALIVLCLFKAAQIAWRYYRDCKPKVMATPHKDSRNWSQQYMDSIK